MRNFMAFSERNLNRIFKVDITRDYILTIEPVANQPTLTLVSSRDLSDT